MKCGINLKNEYINYIISAKLISANKTVQREEYQDAMSIFF